MSDHYQQKAEERSFEQRYQRPLPWQTGGDTMTDRKHGRKGKASKWNLELQAVKRQLREQRNTYALVKNDGKLEVVQIHGDDDKEATR